MMQSYNESSVTPVFFIVYLIIQYFLLSNIVSTILCVCVRVCVPVCVAADRMTGLGMYIYTLQICNSCTSTTIRVQTITGMLSWHLFLHPPSIHPTLCTPSAAAGCYVQHISVGEHGKVQATLLPQKVRFS